MQKLSSLTTSSLFTQLQEQAQYKPGKRVFGDLKHGESKEFPTNLRTQDGFVNSRSQNPDSYMQTPFDKQQMRSLSKKEFYGSSGHENDRKLGEYGENALKKVNFHLFKNADMSSKVEQTPRKTNLTSKIIDGTHLNTVFQDYNITENSSPQKCNYVEIKQKPFVQYNCVLDKNEVINDVSLTLEKYSKYRDNYYNLVSNSPKPFHLKKGMCTYLADASHNQKDCGTLNTIQPMKSDKSLEHPSFSSYLPSYSKKVESYSPRLKSKLNSIEPSPRSRTNLKFTYHTNQTRFSHNGPFADNRIPISNLDYEGVSGITRSSVDKLLSPTSLQFVEKLLEPKIRLKPTLIK